MRKQQFSVNLKEGTEFRHFEHKVVKESAKVHHFDHTEVKESDIVRKFDHKCSDNIQNSDHDTSIDVVNNQNYDTHKHVSRVVGEDSERLARDMRRKEDVKEGNNPGPGEPDSKKIWGFLK